LAAYFVPAAGAPVALENDAVGAHDAHSCAGRQGAGSARRPVLPPDVDAARADRRIDAFGDQTLGADERLRARRHAGRRGEAGEHARSEEHPHDTPRTMMNAAICVGRLRPSSAARALPPAASATKMTPKWGIEISTIAASMATVTHITAVLSNIGTGG
jgi:hypothetical protein